MVLNNDKDDFEYQQYLLSLASKSLDELQKEPQSLKVHIVLDRTSDNSNRKIKKKL